MSPEAKDHLDKAREHLAKAQTILQLGNYADEAGRCAYLAAFHAAQAFIAERTGRAARRHAGVHSQFNLLTKGDPRVSAELRRFLTEAFDLKSAADYEVGADAFVSAAEAEAAITTATQFVDRIAEILAEGAA